MKKGLILFSLMFLSFIGMSALASDVGGVYRADLSTIVETDSAFGESHTHTAKDLDSDARQAYDYYIVKSYDHLELFSGPKPITVTLIGNHGYYVRDDVLDSTKVHFTIDFLVQGDVIFVTWRGHAEITQDDGRKDDSDIEMKMSFIRQ